MGGRRGHRGARFPCAAPIPVAPIPAAPIAGDPGSGLPALGGPGAPPAALPAPAAPPAPPKPAAPAKPAGVPCAATVRACIDLAHNKAWLLRGGVVEYGPVPITSGTPGLPHAGRHVPRAAPRSGCTSSRAFDDAPMPYSVFFIPGIAFHQGSLVVTSHGCIHLSKAAAIRFFGSLARGDVVQAVR